MTSMTKMERVRAVLDGAPPDRPPVSFWCHFAPDAARGRAALDAHLDHLSTFDVDFLKVMNDNPYPALPPIRGVADLASIPVFRGDEEGFGDQLELLRAVSGALSGEVLLPTTLFNAWSVLRRVVRHERSKGHKPPVLQGFSDPVDTRLSELLAEDHGAVAAALDRIAASLANFARRCIDAGADGVFLSVREDWINTDANGHDAYARLVRDGDLKILDAVRGARCNILHVCGVPQDLSSFAEYPVHVINWADRAAGPAIAEVAGRVKPALAGGVDNLGTLPTGTPDDVAAEVRDALRQAGGHPFFVTPGCTYDPEVVPEANLHAMVEAARAPGRG